MIRFTFVLLLLVLESHKGVTSPLFHVSNKILGIGKTTVTITNGLDNGQVLQVHCKSKNTDLGPQALQPNGAYSFKFQPNVIVLNTLFWCSFIWPGQPLKYFEIYKEKRDQRCNKCNWMIRPYGPCLSQGANYLCYPWNA